MFVVISITYYMEIHNGINIYYRSHVLPLLVKHGCLNIIEY